MALYKKWLFIWLIAIASLAACASQAIIVKPQANYEFAPRQGPQLAAPEQLMRKHHASLSAIGDVLIHEPLYEDAKIGNAYDFTPMFRDVRPYLEASDITVANSESIIGGSSIGLSSYPSFNSPFEVGDALEDAGIDVVSMANNHTLDRGVQAIENALFHWRQLGVVTTGSYLTDTERTKVSIIEENGITFSFLSYTYGTNGVPTPAGREHLVNRIDRELIQQDLANARQHSDVTVLSLHFGNEYETMPSAEQVELAHFAAEQGADIILGHHPHVLQPPAWIETSDGRRSFAFYSLGNFLSGQIGVERNIGGIVHLDIALEQSAEGSRVTIDHPTFTPTFVRSSGSEDFEVVLLKDVDPKWNETTKAHLTTWMPELEFRE